MIKSWPQLSKQEEFEFELEMSPAFSHWSLSATRVHNKFFRVFAVVNGNNMLRLCNRNFKMFKFFVFREWVIEGHHYIDVKFLKSKMYQSSTIAS